MVRQLVKGTTESVYDIEIGIENLPEELQPYATGVWTDELLAAQQAAQEQFHLEHGIETE